MRSMSARPVLAELERVTAFFEGALSEGGAPQRARAQVNVAVDEIFSNIVYYSGATRVELECSVSAQCAVMRFVDDGQPYDPTQMAKPNVALPLEERSVGGMGIFMVKELMDGMYYARCYGLNALTVEKRW